ncbi:MAG: hypothetical protein ACI4MM_05095 [Candidatus Ventricola sp.]
MSKPMCPWCGREMHLFCRTPKKDPPFWYNCHDEKCFASAPLADTQEEALAVAIRHPVQKPLTLEQLSEYEDKPVFVEYGFRKPNWAQPKIETARWLLLRWFGKGAEEYRPYIDFVTTCIPDNDGCYTLDFRRREYGKTWRAWDARPTDEERAAAKWE